jgi:hypothetical protein
MAKTFEDSEFDQAIQDSEMRPNQPRSTRNSKPKVDFGAIAVTPISGKELARQHMREILTDYVAEFQKGMPEVMRFVGEIQTQASQSMKALPPSSDDSQWTIDCLFEGDINV